MARRATTRNESVIVCPCGQRLQVRPAGAMTREVCTKCGLSLRVEWGKDARQRPVPLVVYASKEGTPPKPTPSPAPRPAAPSRPITPAPPPAASEVRCDCGTLLQVGPEHVGLTVACPDCDAELAIQRGRDPQTFATVLRKVVVKPGTTRRTGAGRDTATRHQKDAEPEKFWCACGRQLLVRHDDVGKQAECHGCGRLMKLETVKDPQTLRLSIRAVHLERDTAQDLICSCGAEMMIYPQDLGKELQCPRCGTRMRVKLTRDPETNASTLQVKVIGADDTFRDLHDDTWSLDDFK